MKKNAFQQPRWAVVSPIDSTVTQCHINNHASTLPGPRPCVAGRWPCQILASRHWLRLVRKCSVTIFGSFELSCVKSKLLNRILKILEPRILAFFDALREEVQKAKTKQNAAAVDRKPVARENGSRFRSSTYMGSNRVSSKG